MMEREGGWGERLCGVFVCVCVMQGSVGCMWRGPRNAIKGVQVLKQVSIVCRSSQSERCRCPPCRHDQMAILAVTPARQRPDAQGRGATERFVFMKSFLFHTSNVWISESVVFDQVVSHPSCVKRKKTCDV